MTMHLCQDLQHGSKGKRTTSGGRCRIGWMFPILAVLSMLMNSSLHRTVQRMRRSRGISEVERGPPATKFPTKQSLIDDAIAIRAMQDSEYRREKERKNRRGAGRRPTGAKALPPRTHPKAKQTPKPTNTLNISTNKRMEKKTTLTGGMAVTQTSVKMEQPANPSSSIAACLLIRDDNDILNEWIAYHYHVLRMRRLIVAVDPNSETSPSVVLNNWRDMIKIDLWTDEKYMPKDFLRKGMPPRKEIKNITKFSDVSQEEMMEINSHRYRQRVFLTECFKKVKKEKRTWAIHVDTDEYVVPNKLLRDSKSEDVSIQPIEEPGSVLNLVEQLVQTNSKQVNYPCITMLRLLFGSVESEESEWKLSLPSKFDRNSFETLRWRHHGPTDDVKMHGYPKVLIDLSKVPDRYLNNDIVYSIHRPFQSLCRGQGESDYAAFMKYPITTNHYLGSWERYNARNDKRRSWAVYNEKASLKDGEDTYVDGWLKGFVNDVGQDMAEKLLGQNHLKAIGTNTRRDRA